jgi:16S rRNA (uracil1498-N3)-methyltransferase
MFWMFAQPSQLAGERVTFDVKQSHHLGRVLRVRAGERGVVVAAGREHDVEVLEVGDLRVVARVKGERAITTEPPIAVTLWQAVLPNADFDNVIVNGTAVGVRRFVPIQAARSIARPESTRSPRWQRLIESAAEQSHRGELPSATDPMTLEEALSRELGRTRLLVLDPTASEPLAGAIDSSPAYTVAVGPEGGWTTEEMSLMAGNGGSRVNLGPLIMRARLAPVIAAAILLQPR